MAYMRCHKVQGLGQMIQASERYLYIIKGFWRGWLTRHTIQRAFILKAHACLAIPAKPFTNFFFVYVSYVKAQNKIRTKYASPFPPLGRVDYIQNNHMNTEWIGQKNKNITYHDQISSITLTI